MPNVEAWYDAFGKAHLKRGEWVLKQLEIADSKIVKDQLSVSNQVFATSTNKFQQYLTDYGAITQRFGETYSKLSGEQSNRLDEVLELATNSSPGIRNLVVQNAKLEMDARQTLFKLLGTMQDGLDLVHEQNIASLVVLFELDASPQRTAFLEELKKGVIDKFLGLIPGVDFLLIAYRAVEAAALARIRQGKSANEFLVSIEKFNDGGLRWLAGINAYIKALKEFNPIAGL